MRVSAPDRPSVSLQRLLVCLLMGIPWLGCSSRSETTWNQSITSKNQSIASLENGADDPNGKGLVEEAIRGFRDLVKSYPTETMGHANLCVALLIECKKLDSQSNRDERSQLSRSLEEAIARFRKIAPTDPDVDILESRYYQWLGERAIAVDLLRAACKKNEADASTFYQLYQLLMFDEEATSSQEVDSILKQALQRSPQNFVLVVAQFDFMAKHSDDRLQEMIEFHRELFRPLMARTSSRIPQLLDKAVEASQNKDWNGARTQIAFLRNLLLAELAYQNDLYLLERHDLEYVRMDFSSSWHQRWGSEHKRKVRKATMAWEAAKDRTIDWKDVTAIATEDLDLDGNSDLIVARSGKMEAWGLDTQGIPNRLLVSIEAPFRCRGFALADFDHDYQYRKDALPASALPTTNPPDVPPSENAMFVDTDVDLVAFGEDGVRLYKNELDQANGTRSWIEMPQSTDFGSLRGIRAVAVIDFDHDSDLDLSIASDQGLTLWSNRGDWTFADFTPFSDLPKSVKVDSILALDLDRNVLNDFLLGSEAWSAPLHLSNNLHGRYHPRNTLWFKAKKEQQSPMGWRAMDAIDANGDACWDIIACGKSGTWLQSMKSIGRKGWEADSLTELSPTPMTGLLTNDFDNDGYVDCVGWGEQGMEIFFGGEDGKLSLARGAMPVGEAIEQVIAIDTDRDGDDDLMALDGQGSLRRLINQGGNRSRRLEICIRADEEGKQRPRERCNMHGVGSLIELKNGPRYQSRIVRGTRTRFGLGESESADIMRVLWTNGIPNNVLNVSSRATIYDQQNLGGSCPYLYAWNGDRFAFCTDCLWAAPIGLQFAQGVVAPTREWEYLKVDGEQLAPKNDRYVLQVTEELWEAAYFDTVQLMAIDHKEDLEVFTNEKVGPPNLAEFRIHTVRERRLPKAVLDPAGNDLSEWTAKRDQRYTRTWKEGFNQGLVEEHWIEIDLNLESSSTGEVTLFLTGWVFPTCTSLNLAMTENPLLPQLRPPSIQVPNEKGEWIEVLPFAGFPGGKTKTIAIDLTGKFLCDDRRVRVVTNMELCWDEVFWKVNDATNAGKENEDYRLTRLKLLRADLHWRGFSELVPQGSNAPKRFEYDRVIKDSIWPPMSGAVTRYGDVTELLNEPDDRQVVLVAGDEMTVEFEANLSKIPKGWKRDYILYNVGWDKDADLNTVHGQSSEPLPFRAMKQYPYAPEEAFPDSPSHREFLEKYQTRKQDPGIFWNQIRDFRHAKESP